MEKLLRALGVYVVEVPAMPDEGCWVGTQRVALVRAGLSPTVRREVLDEMLQHAFGLR